MSWPSFAMTMATMAKVEWVTILARDITAGMYLWVWSNAVHEILSAKTSAGWTQIVCQQQDKQVVHKYRSDAQLRVKASEICF